MMLRFCDDFRISRNDFIAGRLHMSLTNQLLLVS